MTPDELKAACIAAGGEITVDSDGHWYVRFDSQYLYDGSDENVRAIVMARLLAQAPHPVTFTSDDMKWTWCEVGERRGLEFTTYYGPDHATAFWRAFKAMKEKN